MQPIHIEILGPAKVSVLERKEGGFGEVLIVADVAAEASYAFKVLKQNVESYESVVTEVNALGRLPAHPHVVEVAGYSKSDIGPGILLPFYPKDLRSKMQSGGSLEEKLRVAEHILRGLQHIHEHGILHLDMKPDNVLISKDGHAAISDFGISKLLEKPDLKDNPTLKVSLPQISGTLIYMAPEQLLEADVSLKTDVFAFGILLHEMIVGRLPWTGNTVQEYARGILYGSVKFGMKERYRIPKWLRSIITACLEKAPRKRPKLSELLHGILQRTFNEPVALSHEDILVREINRASVLAESGKHDEAVGILEKVLKEDPWNLTARINLAEFQFVRGNVAEAVASSRLTLQLAPWNGSEASSEQVLYLNLALYLMTSNPYEAFHVTVRALKRFPDNWELMHNHAEACRLVSIDITDHGGDAKAKAIEGIPYIQAVLQVKPKDVSARVTYAGLLRLAGQREQFIPYINKLLHDAGSHSVATRLLFLDALIDENKLARAEQQIDELSQFDVFRGLLDGKKKRLDERRAASN